MGHNLKEDFSVISLSANQYFGLYDLHYADILISIFTVLVENSENTINDESFQKILFLYHHLSDEEIISKRARKNWSIGKDLSSLVQMHLLGSTDNKKFFRNKIEF